MAPSPPPSASAHRLRTVFHADRAHAHCTHRTLTRLYDQHGQQRCMVCHRVPDFGFLYRCTQDTDGNLPISDFIDEDMTMDLADLRVDSRSMPFGDSNITYSASASAPTTNAFAPITALQTKDDLGDESASDDILAQAFEGKRKFDAAFPPEPVEPTTGCDIRVCHTCRPVFRDRAWQSLTSIVNTTAPILPSQHEFDNRRISNATVVSNIRSEPIEEVDMADALIIQPDELANTEAPHNQSNQIQSNTTSRQRKRNVSSAKPRKRDAENDGSDADDEKESTTAEDDTTTDDDNNGEDDRSSDISSSNAPHYRDDNNNNLLTPPRLRLGLHRATPDPRSLTPSEEEDDSESSSQDGYGKTLCTPIDDEDDRQDSNREGCPLADNGSAGTGTQLNRVTPGRFPID